jgi:hypothetical protein
MTCLRPTIARESSLLGEYQLWFLALDAAAAIEDFGLARQSLEAMKISVKNCVSL